MLDSVLPLTENSFTGANVLILGVEIGVLEVPLHEVQFNKWQHCNRYETFITFRRNIIKHGNGLAGEIVMVDPREVEKPREDEKTEMLAEKFPGIFPAYVVTRSMKAKKEAIKEQGKEEVGLPGTFLENTEGKSEERNKEKEEKALVRSESITITITITIGI